MTDYERLKEYRKANNQFANLLGIEITEMKPGYAKGEMNIDRQFYNPIHSVHGGCIFSLADTIGGAAAATSWNRMTTVSSDFHYLSPAMNTSKLVAIAKEIKKGKKISVYDVEILNDQNKLLAKGTFSYYNLGTPIMEQPD